MFKKFKFLIHTKPFILLTYYLIRAYSLTFRMQVINEKNWQNLLQKKKTILLCTWHQQFFSAIRHFKFYSDLNPGLMISKSRDGDLISGVARRSGWHTPRGSSTRGGKQAMHAMINHLLIHRLGAHILDGPRGPIGKVKSGVIKIARDTGALVVPFTVSANHAWYFNSWDRFMLPKPFARVVITFGDEIDFASASDARSFEAQRYFLEQTMRPQLVL